MSAAELSYAANIVLASGGIGSFFAGRRIGAEKVKGETNEAQRQTIEAQKERIDLLMLRDEDNKQAIKRLVAQNEEQQKKLDYLEGLITRGVGAGTTVVVQPGAVPLMSGQGRGDPSTDPAGSGDGSVR